MTCICKHTVKPATWLLTSQGADLLFSYNRFDQGQTTLVRLHTELQSACCFFGVGTNEEKTGSKMHIRILESVRLLERSMSTT